MIIITLLTQDHVKLNRVSNKDKSFYKSPCPFCGGTDRFHIWSNQGNGGRWWCRQCKQYGDAIDYLQLKHSFTFPEAKQYLEQHFNLQFSSQPEKNSLKHDLVIERQVWQNKAFQFINNSTYSLHYTKDQDVFTYLHARGLQDHTIEQFLLGYNPLDAYSEWGISKKGNIFLPAGIVIPFMYQDQVQFIKIRRFIQETPRYLQVTGSLQVPYILNPKRNNPVIMVESELDALLIHQETKGLFCTVATGSAQYKPREKLVHFLNHAPLILIALDNDSAGNQASEIWLKEFPHAKRLPILEGKDPTESFQQGINIREWILTGLKIHGVTVFSAGFLFFSKQQKLINTPTEPTDTDLNSALKSISLSPRVAVFVDQDAIHFITQEVSLTHYFSKCNQSERDLLNQVLQNQQVKVFHDAKDQLKLLKSKGLNYPSHIRDIRIMARILDKGSQTIPYGLTDLTHFFATSLNSPVQTESIQSQGKALLELDQVLEQKIQEEELFPTLELEMNVLPVITEMERNGMGIKKTELIDLISIFHSLEKELQSCLGFDDLEHVGKMIAALQLKGMLITDLDEDYLNQFAGQYPIIKKVIRYRRLYNHQNFLKNLIKATESSNSSRIYPIYNQIGTRTGRMSCSNPPIQNTPKVPEIRQLFVPESGNVFVTGDYAQNEVRILAEITGDEKLVEIFQYDEDPYRHTASVILDKPVDQVTEEERNAAKVLFLGITYGMGVKGMAQYAAENFRIWWSMDEAKEYLQRFYGFYTGINQWKEQIILSKPKEMKTLNGRKRIWKEDAPLTELLNTPIQGTGADMIKKALVRVYEGLTGTQGRIIACIHDEIIVECPENKGDKVKNILEVGMVEAGEKWLKRVPVKVEVDVRRDWIK